MTSAGLVLGPAAIAGGIGLVSALLSYKSSQSSLAISAQNAQREREHQRELLIFDRRLQAIASVWQLIFELEQSDQLTEKLKAEIVREVVWLPENIGQKVLLVLLDFANGTSQPADLESLRGDLQKLTEAKQQEK